MSALRIAIEKLKPGSIITQISIADYDELVRLGLDNNSEGAIDQLWRDAKTKRERTNIKKLFMLAQLLMSGDDVKQIFIKREWRTIRFTILGNGLFAMEFLDKNLQRMKV